MLTKIYVAKLIPILVLHQPASVLVQLHIHQTWHCSCLASISCTAPEWSITTTNTAYKLGTGVSQFSPYSVDDKSTLVQVMTWCCQAKSHHLSQCWPRHSGPDLFPALPSTKQPVYWNSFASIKPDTVPCVASISWPAPGWSITATNTAYKLGACMAQSTPYSDQLGNNTKPFIAWLLEMLTIRLFSVWRVISMSFEFIWAYHVCYNFRRRKQTVLELQRHQLKKCFRCEPTCIIWQCRLGETCHSKICFREYDIVCVTQVSVFHNSIVGGITVIKQAMFQKGKMFRNPLLQTSSLSHSYNLIWVDLLTHMYL